MLEIMLSLCLMIVTLLSFYYFRPQMRPVLMAADTTPQLGTRPSTQPTHLTDISVNNVQNPFNIELNESQSSAKDGILFKIQSLNKTFNMVIAWCVDIKSFYEQLEKTPNQMFFERDELFLSNCSSKIEHKKFNLDVINDIDMHYPVPWQCAEKFNSTENSSQTRDYFQLVIALYREKTDFESLSTRDIAANIWVIHLKDKKLNTKVIYNFLKCCNNKIVNINRIYANDLENMCIVCQTNRSNQVLLPCNHNCLCQECVEKVSLKCPMCRTQIQSKFQI